MRRTLTGLAMLGILCAPAVTLAQNTASPAPGTTHSGQDRAIEKDGAQANLSNRLAQSNGTLHPPPVDPGMQKTPTVGGTMPVVRPPGTPGGNPRVVPK
jgi:hypothetical protein